VLRRTVARQLCEAGRISVNGYKAKASKEIKPGDLIEIRRGDRRTIARVAAIPSSKQVARAVSTSLTEVIADETLPNFLH